MARRLTRDCSTLIAGTVIGYQFEVQIGVRISGDSDPTVPGLGGLYDRDRLSRIKDGGALRYRGVDIEDPGQQVTHAGCRVGSTLGQRLPPAEMFPLPPTPAMRVDVQAGSAMLALISS